MGGAIDFLGKIMKDHHPATYADITPEALLGQGAHNLAAAITLRTLRSILVRLDV
jgi:hypothetical protein